MFKIIQTSDGSYKFSCNQKIQEHISGVNRVVYYGFPSVSNLDLKKILENFEYKKNKLEFEPDLKGSYLLFIFINSSKEFYLYRDSWGSHPVYFSVHSNTVSDSMSSVLEGVSNLELNKKYIPEYLMSSYIVGQDTLYENVFSMTPMHSLHMAEKGKYVLFRVKKYPQVDSRITQNDLVEMLEQSLDRSIEWFTNSFDAEDSFAVSLSGGTDSSLLTAKLIEKNFKNLICGTVEYTEWDRNDTPYFNFVADQYGLKKQISTIDNNLYAKSLVELEEQGMYPYHTFAPAFFHLMKSVKSNNPKVKYIFNGTGPDEAVIGFEKVSYDEFVKYLKLPKNLWVETLLEKFDYCYTPPKSISRILTIQNESAYFATRTKLAEHIAQESPDFCEFQRRYAMETITDHHIRMLHDISLMNGVEMLFPYLTEELFNLCFKAPFTAINDAVSYKHIFKRILLKYFPKDFVYRPKIGFHAPSRKYFKAEEGMGALLKALPPLDAEIFNETQMNQEIHDRLFVKDAPLDYLLWTSTNIRLLDKRIKSKKIK